MTKSSAWLASLPQGNLEFIFTDPSLFTPALSGTRFADAVVTAAPRALAGAAACIAARAYLCDGYSNSRYGDPRQSGRGCHSG